MAQGSTQAEENEDQKKKYESGIRSLRASKAELERIVDAPYRKNDQDVLVLPTHRRGVNASLEQIRASGRAVPDWYIREELVIPKNKRVGRNYDGISGRGLLADVNRYLKEFDPDNIIE